MGSNELFERVFPGRWASGHQPLDGLVSGASAPFSPQELFEIFVAVREDRLRAPSVVFFNYETAPNVFSRQEGAPTKPEHIPAASDLAFAGYSARLKTVLNGARFCLRMTEPHVGSHAVYERLARLVAPLGEILAAESRAVRTTVFVGDYEYTPFGVHVDPYPQIQCVVSGERTALFWDGPYWADLGNDERLAPWDHLEAAHEVKMRTGDAVYWASAYEHAFSSRGEHAIALTISFPEVSAPESSEEAARRRSANYFLNMPPARSSRAFPSDQVFVGNALLPLTITASHGQEASVVAAGRVFNIAGVASLPAFVARVNDKTPFRYGDLGGIDEETARALVDVFYTHYAIDALGG